VTDRHRHPLTEAQVADTGAFIADRQTPDGRLPWIPDAKWDPWDHVHAAMGLVLAGRLRDALRAFHYLVRTQLPEGGWHQERHGDALVSDAQETNHAAYFATGLWHLYLHTRERDFLVEYWPAMERAIDFVVGMQLPHGPIAWLLNKGEVWRAPLLTGSSSIHGSLVCAIRIAETLGHERPAWRTARRRLADVLRNDIDAFERTDLPEGPGRFSMDWYYPVLGGALRGVHAWRRLLDRELVGRFLQEGVGARCERDRPWYTTAETCELVLALDACGLHSRARQVFNWVKHLRTAEGGYYTGRVHPEDVIWPVEEQTLYTAATVLIACDALTGLSATSGLFRGMAGVPHAAPVRPWPRMAEDLGVPGADVDSARG
jgi:hypothetical protein